MQKKIRMKVLKRFSKNLDGQIVVGHPEHPDEDGRFVNVSEGAAKILEDAELAKPYSLKQQMRDEILAEGGEVNENDEDDDDENEDDDAAAGGVDVEAATTAGTGAAESAQEVRNRRTNTSGKGPAGGKPGGKGGRRRAAPKKGASATANQVGGLPTGGHDTNASTNHPTTSASGSGISAATNDGVNAEPGADAAPSE